MELSGFGELNSQEVKPKKQQNKLSSKEKAEFNEQLMSSIEHLAANFVMQISSISVDKNSQESSESAESAGGEFSSLISGFDQSEIMNGKEIHNSGIKFLNEELDQLIDQSNIGNPENFMQLLTDVQNDLNKDVTLFKSTNNTDEIPVMFEDMTQSDDELSDSLFSEKLTPYLSELIDELPDNVGGINDGIKSYKISTQELLDNVLKGTDNADLNIDKTVSYDKNIFKNKKLNLDLQNIEQTNPFNIEDLKKFSQDLKDLNLEEVKLQIESKPVFKLSGVQNLKMAQFLAEEIDNEVSNNTDSNSTLNNLANGSANDNFKKENLEFLSQNENFQNLMNKSIFGRKDENAKNNSESLNLDSSLNNNEQDNNKDNFSNTAKDDFLSIIKNNLFENKGISNTSKESGKPLLLNNIMPKDLPETTLKLIGNMNNNDTTTARISMTPKTLGTLIVEIRMIENKVKIDFKTEKKESITAIENQISVLKDKLVNSGLTIDKIEVKQNTDYFGAFANFNKQEGEKKEQYQTKNDYLKTFKNLNNVENNFENKLEDKNSMNHGRLIEKYV